jgi:tetratricopeptide (TPR) repeat protein
MAQGSPREGFAWYKQVVAVDEDLPARFRSRLLGDTAYAAMNAGDDHESVNYARYAIEVGGHDAPAVAHWLLGVTGVEPESADYAVAAGHFRRAVATAAAAGDVAIRAQAVGGLVYTVAFPGDFEEARRLIPEAIERAERLGNPTLLAVAYMESAVALARTGVSREAGDMFERALVLADAGGPSTASGLRVVYALNVDDPRHAARLLQSAIPIARKHLIGVHESLPLLGAAKVAAEYGSEQTAARLLGAYLYHGRGWSGLPGERWHYDGLVSQVTGRLGAATFQGELRLGAQLSIDEALQLAEDIVSATATEATR